MVATLSADQDSSMKYFGGASGCVRIEHQDGRTPLHQPGHQTPVADLGVIAEIARHFGLAVQARLVDEFEPDVVGDHGADGVEIPRVEMRDIGGEPRAIGVRQLWLRRVVRLIGDFAQLRAPAMQRGLQPPAG